MAIYYIQFYRHTCSKLTALNQSENMANLNCLILFCLKMSIFYCSDLYIKLDIQRLDNATETPGFRSQ